MTSFMEMEIKFVQNWVRHDASTIKKDKDVIYQNSKGVGHRVAECPNSGDSSEQIESRANFLFKQQYWEVY